MLQSEDVHFGSLLLQQGTVTLRGLLSPTRTKACQPLNTAVLESRTNPTQETRAEKLGRLKVEHFIVYSPLGLGNGWGRKSEFQFGI